MKVELFDCQREFDFDNSVVGVVISLRATRDDGAIQEVVYPLTSAELGQDLSAIITRESQKLVADLLRQDMAPEAKFQQATDILASISIDASDPTNVATATATPISIQASPVSVKTTPPTPAPITPGVN